MAKNEEDKSAHKKSQREGNVYDRIFKENFHAVFLPLVAQELNIEIDHYQELSVELPKTIERKADFLAEVTTKDEKTLILQVEFQTKDDPKMLERMMLYHALLFGKFQKEIKQMVVYLGGESSKMRTKPTPKEQFDGFFLLSLRDLSTQRFLEAEAPEMVLLALLTGYEQEQSERLLRSIIEQLQKKSEPAALKKYLQQLLLLSRIRQLENLTFKAIEDMPIDYKIEDSLLFKKGKQQNMEQVLTALKCLKEGKSHEETALISGLTVEEVRALDLQD